MSVQKLNLRHINWHSTGNPLYSLDMHAEITGPFEIMRWDHSEAPTLERLQRIMDREGFAGGVESLAASAKTPEMKFDKEVFLAPVAGVVQVAFPGYGVIELNPGDILEIQPHTTHDMIAIGKNAEILKGMN